MLLNEEGGPECGGSARRRATPRPSPPMPPRRALTPAMRHGAAAPLPSGTRRMLASAKPEPTSPSPGVRPLNLERKAEEDQLVHDRVLQYCREDAVALEKAWAPGGGRVKRRTFAAGNLGGAGRGVEALRGHGELFLKFMPEEEVGHRQPGEPGRGDGAVPASAFLQRVHRVGWRLRGGRVDWRCARATASTGRCPWSGATGP